MMMVKTTKHSSRRFPEVKIGLVSLGLPHILSFPCPCHRFYLISSVPIPDKHARQPTSD